jgi:ferrochelatase
MLSFITSILLIIGHIEFIITAGVLLPFTITRRMTAHKGVILMNLGSPASTDVKDVRRYLKEFLMDKRVIDYPYIFRSLLVKGIIVPFKASKSAEAYKTIWWKEGSPLIELTRRLRKAVQEEVTIPVTLSMRYGAPTPAEAYEEILSLDPRLEEVILLPLYPHYAMSSYETAVEYMKEVHHQKGYAFRLTTIRPYYNDPLYIQAMVENIRPHIQNDYDHLLFSYHGIPARHIHKSDITGQHCLSSTECCSISSPAHQFCYRHQCFETTKLVAAQLGLPANKHSISFQSRLGKGWLEPFTDVRLTEFPSQGIKKLLVVCPAFVSDCLETLEEIAERGKQSFMHAGGTSFEMIPCLNTHPLWVKAVSSWINGVASGKKEMMLS